MQKIEELSNLNGISGFEKNVYNYMKSNISDSYKILDSDGLGSFISKYEGEKDGLTIAVIAHMDEVGFMVKSITKKGFIHVMAVGGIVAESMLSTQVMLTNNQGEKFSGVILSTPPHLLKESKVATIETLMVDFGFTSDIDANNHGVKKGDMITFKNDFSKLPNDRFIGKAFDNRLGCRTILELSERLINIEYGNIYLCATTQEEIGLRGAQTILHKIDGKIDYVVVVDVSPVNDVNVVENCEIGGGCLIRVKDPRMIFDRTETIKLEEIAVKKKIMHQHYFSQGGTDGAMLQIQKDGFVTCAICIPARNIHTHNAIVDYKDYCSCVDLIEAYVLDKVEGNDEKYK